MKIKEKLNKEIGFWKKTIPNLFNKGYYLLMKLLVIFLLAAIIFDFMDTKWIINSMAVLITYIVYLLGGMKK